MGREKEQTSALTRKQHLFLAAYETEGTLIGAQQVSKVMRENHRRWIKQKTYQEAFAAAEEIYVDTCEAELHRRAYRGVDEPVVYQGALQYEPKRNADGSIKRDKKGLPVLGEVPLTIKRYSDNLLMFHLKSKRPERYRDNATVEHTGPGGGPVRVEIVFEKPNAGTVS